MQCWKINVFFFFSQLETKVKAQHKHFLCGHLLRFLKTIYRGKGREGKERKGKMQTYEYGLTDKILTPTVIIPKFFFFNKNYH
jgi:hypothetical protein